MTSQNYRIAVVGRGLWKSPSPTTAKGGSLQLVKQESIQAGLEYFWRMSLHSHPELHAYSNIFLIFLVLAYFVCCPVSNPSISWKAIDNSWTTVHRVNNMVVTEEMLIQIWFLIQHWDKYQALSCILFIKLLVLLGQDSFAHILLLWPLMASWT